MAGLTFLDVLRLGCPSVLEKWIVRWEVVHWSSRWMGAGEMVPSIAVLLEQGTLSSHTPSLRLPQLSPGGTLGPQDVGCMLPAQNIAPIQPAHQQSGSPCGEQTETWALWPWARAPLLGPGFLLSKWAAQTCVLYRGPSSVRAEVLCGTRELLQAEAAPWLVGHGERLSEDLLLPDGWPSGLRGI